MKKIIIICVFICSYFLPLQAQTWEILNNTDFVRHHGVSFSIDGYGYLITGSDAQGASKNVQKYDPVKDEWENLGDYPGPARGFGIGQSWNGKGYFGFGRGSSALNDLWEFDPKNNTFTELPQCPCIGRTHPAFVILDGKVYVGMGGNGGDLSDWWEYDIASKNWTQKKDIPIRRHHPYQFVIDNYIYVGSGHRDSWYKYDPSKDTWTSITSLDDRVAGTQFSFKGKGYALSGLTNNHKAFFTGEFFEYDPISNQWNRLKSHPGGSLWAPGSFIIDNYVYLFTGTANGYSPFSESMYRYNLDPNATSVNSFSNSNNGFTLYPNPVSDKVTFNLDINNSEKTLVEIYNTLGAKVYSASISNNVMNLGHLKSGIYTIRILSGDKQLHQKIIKN